MSETKTTTGAEAIRAERIRQIEQEGYSEGHDDAHTPGNLARGALVYLENHLHKRHMVTRREHSWPWYAGSFKPTGDIRDLIKAGAMIAAEIDREDRHGIRFVRTSKEAEPEEPSIEEFAQQWASDGSQLAARLAAGHVFDAKEFAPIVASARSAIHSAELAIQAQQILAFLAAEEAERAKGKSAAAASDACPCCAEHGGTRGG